MRAWIAIVLLCGCNNGILPTPEPKDDGRARVMVMVADALAEADGSRPDLPDTLGGGTRQAGASSPAPCPCGPACECQFCECNDALDKPPASASDARFELHMASGPYCPPCVVAEGELSRSQRIRLVVRKDYPAWVKSLPAFWWETPDGRTWRYPGSGDATGGTGYPGEAALWGAIQRSLAPRSEVPAVRFQSAAPSLKSARLTPAELRAWASQYRGTPGYVRGMSHLYHLTDPRATDHHGGPFEPWQLAGLTEGELSKIHGAQHSRMLSPFGPRVQQRATYQVARPVVTYRSNCPGGACPTWRR